MKPEEFGKPSPVSRRSEQGGGAPSNTLPARGTSAERKSDDIHIFERQIKSRIESISRPPQPDSSPDASPQSAAESPRSPVAPAPEPASGPVSEPAQQPAQKPAQEPAPSKAAPPRPKTPVANSPVEGTPEQPARAALPISPPTPLAKSFSSPKLLVPSRVSLDDALDGTQPPPLPLPELSGDLPAAPRTPLGPLGGSAAAQEGWAALPVRSDARFAPERVPARSEGVAHWCDAVGVRKAAFQGFFSKTGLHPSQTAERAPVVSEMQAFLFGGPSSPLTVAAVLEAACAVLPTGRNVFAHAFPALSLPPDEAREASTHVCLVQGEAGEISVWFVARPEEGGVRPLAGLPVSETFAVEPWAPEACGADAEQATRVTLVVDGIPVAIGPIRDDLNAFRAALAEVFQATGASGARSRERVLTCRYDGRKAVEDMFPESETSVCGALNTADILKVAETCLDSPSEMVLSAAFLEFSKSPVALSRLLDVFAQSLSAKAQSLCRVSEIEKMSFAQNLFLIADVASLYPRPAAHAAYRPLAELSAKLTQSETSISVRAIFSEAMDRFARLLAFSQPEPLPRIARSASRAEILKEEQKARALSCVLLLFNLSTGDVLTSKGTDILPVVKINVSGRERPRDQAPWLRGHKFLGETVSALDTPHASAYSPLAGALSAYATRLPESERALFASRNVSFFPTLLDVDRKGSQSVVVLRGSFPASLEAQSFSVAPFADAAHRTSVAIGAEDAAAFEAALGAAARSEQSRRAVRKAFAGKPVPNMPQLLPMARNLPMAPGTHLAFMRLNTARPVPEVLTFRDVPFALPSVPVTRKLLTYKELEWLRSLRIRTELGEPLVDPDSPRTGLIRKLFPAFESLREFLGEDALRGTLYDVEPVALDQSGSVQLVVLVDQVAVPAAAPVPKNDALGWLPVDVFEAETLRTFHPTRYEQILAAAVREAHSGANEGPHVPERVGQTRSFLAPLRWPTRIVNWAVTGARAITHDLPFELRGKFTPCDSVRASRHRVEHLICRTTRRALFALCGGLFTKVAVAQLEEFERCELELEKAEALDSASKPEQLAFHGVVKVPPGAAPWDDVEEALSLCICGKRCNDSTRREATALLEVSLLAGLTPEEDKTGAIKQLVKNPILESCLNRAVVCTTPVTFALDELMREVPPTPLGEWEQQRVAREVELEVQYEEKERMKRAADVASALNDVGDVISAVHSIVDVVCVRVSVDRITTNIADERAALLKQREELTAAALPKAINEAVETTETGREKLRQFDVSGIEISENIATLTDPVTKFTAPVRFLSEQFAGLMDMADFMFEIIEFSQKTHEDHCRISSAAHVVSEKHRNAARMASSMRPDESTQGTPAPSLGGASELSAAQAGAARSVRVDVDIDELLREGERLELEDETERRLRLGLPLEQRHEELLSSFEERGLDADRYGPRRSFIAETFQKALKQRDAISRLAKTAEDRTGSPHGAACSVAPEVARTLRDSALSVESLKTSRIISSSGSLVSGVRTSLVAPLQKINRLYRQSAFGKEEDEFPEFSFSAVDEHSPRRALESSSPSSVASAASAATDAAEAAAGAEGAIGATQWEEASTETEALPGPALAPGGPAAAASSVCFFETDSGVLVEAPVALLSGCFALAAAAREGLAGKTFRTEGIPKEVIETALTFLERPDAAVRAQIWKNPFDYSALADSLGSLPLFAGSLAAILDDSGFDEELADFLLDGSIAVTAPLPLFVKQVAAAPDQASSDLLAWARLVSGLPDGGGAVSYEERRGRWVREFARATFEGLGERLADLPDRELQGWAFDLGDLVEELSLASNAMVDDEVVEVFTAVCPGLRVVDLSETHITPSALRSLRDSCAGLERVNAAGCPSLQEADPELIRSLFPPGVLIL